MATQTTQSYTSGFFELTIDGHKQSAYLKTAEGGFVKAALTDEPIGPENTRVKHTSVAEIEPVSVEFGLSGAKDVLQWIQQSWKRDPSRRNGSIVHANFDMKTTYEQEFTDALILETTFPGLDGGSKEPAYLKVKFQPERVTTKSQPGTQKLASDGVSPKQKMWLCSGFRVKIDGVDDVDYTNKVDSFTIKQSVKMFYNGMERFPSIEPTKIEFPNIVGNISVAYGTGLQTWYDACVQNGANDPSVQKTGMIEFLAPDKTEVIFRLNLYEVGMLSYKINQSTAHSEPIKRARYELYVGRMEIDGGAMGLA